MANVLLKTNADAECASITYDATNAITFSNAVRIDEAKSFTFTSSIAFERVSISYEDSFFDPSIMSTICGASQPAQVIVDCA